VGTGFFDYILDPDGFSEVLILAFYDGIVPYPCASRRAFCCTLEVALLEGIFAMGDAPLSVNCPLLIPKLSTFY